MKGLPSLIGIALATLALLACSNPIGDIVGSVTVYCASTTAAGVTACVISRDLPSSEQSSVQNECTNNGGQIASACPTTGLVGCCTQTEAEVSVESCYYSGTASELKSQCGSGTWSTSL